MKTTLNQKYHLLICYCFIFIISGCSDVKVEDIIDRSIQFEKVDYCYNESNRDLAIRFQFPINMENNETFKKSTWLGLGARQFKNMAEVKEFLIDEIANEIDVDFVVYEQNGRNLPIKEISLNYNETSKVWDNQELGTKDNAPWEFIVRYTIPDDIFLAKKIVYGAIRIKYEEDDTPKYAFTKPITISYCNCEKKCEKGFILNKEKCECVPQIVEPIDKKCPNGYRLVQGKCVWQPEFLRTDSKIGSLEISTPVKVVMGYNDSGEPILGWVYPTIINTTDPEILKLIKQGQFQFDICRWTIQDLINVNSDSYRKSWTFFVNDIAQSLSANTNESNYFSIILQGSADGGSNCKSVSSMDQYEKMIYDEPLFYLSKTIKGTIEPGGQHNYDNPVRNADLPNLRSAFLRWHMTRSQLSSIVKFGIINGDVIPGRNPNDRKVSIYILQTPFNITEGKYSSYFK